MSKIVGKDIPPKPIHPPCRILREGGSLRKLCPICKSSLKIKYLLGFIPYGLLDKCINPRCTNY